MTNQYRLFKHANGYFYHRVKVPSDIRALYGKQIEQRSLHTRDYRDAVRRLPAVVIEANNAFAQFRTAHRDELVPFALNRVSGVARKSVQHGFKRLVDDFTEMVEAEEIKRRAAAFRTATDDLASYLQQTTLLISTDAFVEECRKRNDISAILSLANRLHVIKRIAWIKNARATGAFDEWEKAADRMVPGLATTRRATLVKALMGAELTVLQAWHQESPDEREGQMPVEAVSIEPGSNDLPFMSIIANECFNSVGREKKWSAKTDAARRSQIEQFVDICGDKPLNRYSQNDIRHLKNTLFALPPQSHGRKELKGLSKIQIAEQAKKLGLSGLSAESVRQIMTAANIVFGWSRTEYDHTLQNIVQPMIPPPSSGGSRKDKRNGFTTD